MYTPKSFRNDNPEELKNFIRENGFGILVSHVDGKLWGTHIPMILNEEGNTLTGHVARGNIQWKYIESAPDVLVIFTGPHAYVSSSWYNHENVPTWNYIAVHVSGKIMIIEGDALLESLKKLVHKYEKDSSHPVSVETMSPKFLDTEIRGIVGFEIVITKIEASYKLSQNRDDENHERIVKALEERKEDGSSIIAASMRKTRSPK